MCIEHLRALMSMASWLQRVEEVYIGPYKNGGVHMLFYTDHWREVHHYDGIGFGFSATTAPPSSALRFASEQYFKYDMRLAREV